MTKIKGFLSQDVTVTRKETPDSKETTFNLPPEWLPLMEKIFRWYDNQAYPVFNPFFGHKTRSAKERNLARSFVKEISASWSGLAAATKALWKTSAAFVERSGYQLFVKDYAYRKKNQLSLPGTPNALHQTHGLLMSNPGPIAQVRLQRDDVQLIGQVTLSFSYKKVENAPTGGDPFKADITLWYFEAGEIKTETHTWSAPAGNVAWASVSETYGTADRFYFHHRIIFKLDNYDADVYFDDVLLQAETLSWTTTYDGTTLPENADPAWAKTGGVSTEKIRGNRLHLIEEKGTVDSVNYFREPSFTNSLGSTVKWRMKIKSGPPKDVFTGEGTWSDADISWSDPAFYWAGLFSAAWSDANVGWSDPNFFWSGLYRQVARVVHCDGVRRAEYLFYSNGFILRLGEQTFKYHLDMTRYRTFRSFIQNDRLYFYHGRTLLFRKELDTSGDQEVSFSHFGSSGFETESRWGFLKYYSGADEDPGLDVLREAWWLKAGTSWEPDTLYRKKGWTFSPGYRLPFFDVVYLT